MCFSFLCHLTREKRETLSVAILTRLLKNSRNSIAINENLDCQVRETSKLFSAFDLKTWIDRWWHLFQAVFSGIKSFFLSCYWAILFSGISANIQYAVSLCTNIREVLGAEDWIRRKVELCCERSCAFSIWSSFLDV